MASRLTPWGGPSIDQFWFDFDRRPVLAKGTAGTPYIRTTRCGMPRIPDEVLESVFYLYESREEAERGSSFGGSGFFVSVQSDIPDILFSYAVTNWHVVVQGGASVIRVNCIGGGVEIFEFDPAEWHFKPGGYDIAVIPVPLKSGRHAVTVLNE